LTPTVRVSAPCRADLAGGTLDIWPLGLLHPGSLTVNVAIPVAVELDLDLDGPAGELLHATGEGEWSKLGPEDARRDLSAAVAFAVLPGGRARVRVRSQASLGSGLGGSSAYAVALGRGLLELAGAEMDDRALVRLMRDLEAQVLAAPTGAQDHWAAVAGGVLALHLEAGGDRVERLTVDPGWISARMTVFDTGIEHHSGMVNWQVVRRRLDGDAATVDGLQSIAEAARRCREALTEADAEGTGRAIAAEWEARRRLAPEVCPQELERVVEAGLAAGAQAVKACGAGGGGSVVAWHGGGLRKAVVDALVGAAPEGRVVAKGIETAGCRVVHGDGRAGSRG
jgi:D-glycero-alpha-D-manno-heptose-7-phosphate kinase